jgi:hypothetical protein
VIGYGGFLRQLLDLVQHDAHRFLGYDEMSTFGTFGGWNILEAKQVVTALHLVGDGFIGDTVASAFLTDHGILVWSNLNPK